MIEDMAENAPVKLLGQILNTEKDPEMRRLIVQILGESENDEAVPILEKLALEDNDKKIRLEAIEALEDLDSPKSRDALKRILSKKEL